MDLDSEAAATVAFDEARSGARADRLRSLFTRRDDRLLAYQAVRRLVAPDSESYCGLATIRVDRIVGSEGRAQHFNRRFLPRHEFLRRRWQDIAAAHYRSTSLPAISVYEMGGVYFVRDGNHRVSVARALKRAFIDAEVVRIRTEVVMDPDMTVEEIAAASRHAKGQRAAANAA